MKNNLLDTSGLAIPAAAQAAMPADFLNGAALAQPTYQQDYPGWRRGREQYAIWLLLLDDAQLIEYINLVRRSLADILLPAEKRALHITLQAVGFPCAVPALDDDVSFDVLKQQAQSVSEQSAFQVQLAGINAFQSALYVPVNDIQGGLARVRQCLNGHAPEIASAGYTPHVTIGLFQPVNEELLRRDVIWARLQQLDALPPLIVEVREVQLVTYKARELQGELNVIERVSLR